MKYKISFSLLLSLMLAAAVTFFSPIAEAATNPFLTPKAGSVESVKPTEKNTPTERIEIINNHSRTLYDSILTEITVLQKEIRIKLAGFAKDIKKNNFGKSFWLFLVFSFAYGVVHAIGPGHGKSVVCAFFLSRRGTMYSAMFMSWLITLVHVGSATAAVCLAYLLLSSGMSGFENFSYHLQTASFAMVSLIGLWIFYSVLRSFFKKNRKEHSSKPAKCASLTEITIVAFVTGLVPCPGAAIILVYTLSTGILWAGLTAMLFLATGMALTTSTFAILAAKTSFAMDQAAKRKTAQILYKAISLLASLIIILFGILMLYSHLK
ncbi:nickel/cobalt transporter [Desulfovibrio gilichinskyi]|uniref:Nickel/cobalt efflux system n=1 Tax=Desulfovibrio gilichinskyi TaxID=1519643 RepID=A0A1X7E1N4_9BACT|nr:nickel ABC transporter permease [Desulfovibrio gilichinskyi]SMF25824.1 ABC-type nickel/cobalt efflux system, permease component RcnA [Desulfovibrio gilichinskyi]